mmetsp:Transcript_11100/g.16300  ORF Transcript_11100/g.16300 Transcript_11100/m.16300 type:complete len:139 (+) Transcript_11100:253-669(+)
MEFLKGLHLRHERLKHAVHNGWRYPLPRWGQAMMGFVYFCVPIIGGWNIMQWAISKSHESIGEQGEKLETKQIEGIGDKRRLENGELQNVGGSGFGGGVRLAVSNESTQAQNRKQLELLFKHELKKRHQKHSRKDNKE